MDPQRYQRIKLILMDALEAPALERGAVVAAACQGDPELHAEVLSLLAQHAEDTFLEPHAVGEQNTRIGSIIGGYRILSALGEGGMGVVYLGEDVRLGRRAALKCLKPELVFHPQAKARFIREARAGATLDHPNICPLYGVDETPDGQLFLAMRFYEGETSRIVLHAAACRLTRVSILPPRWPAALARRIAPALCTATSSRATCFSWTAW